MFRMIFIFVTLSMCQATLAIEKFVITENLPDVAAVVPAQPPVIERVVEKIVTVEKIVKVPASRESTLVWNKEFLETEPPKQEPYRWVMESNPTCIHCTRNWLAAELELGPKGYLFGGEGKHFQKEEISLENPPVQKTGDSYSIPVWKLMLGDKELKRHVGYTSPLVLKAEYLEEYATINAPRGAVKSIDAGTITKEEVEGYLGFFVKWFGPTGKIVLPNLKHREPWNNVNIDVPANVGFSWDHGADGGFTVNFNPDTRPVGRWGIFSQSVSAMIYDPSIGEVRFVTPLARYSPVLKVVE